jgi:hypothetical protein
LTFSFFSPSLTKAIFSPFLDQKKSFVAFVLFPQVTFFPVISWTSIVAVLVQLAV